MYEGREVLLIIQLAALYIEKYESLKCDEEDTLIYEKVMQLYDAITEKARKYDNFERIWFYE